MAREKGEKGRRDITCDESARVKSTRGRKIGYEKPLIDWRKEFGLEGFELPPAHLLAMCEEIYCARIKRLKWAMMPAAAQLMTRTNDAIVAARIALDICPERKDEKQTPVPRRITEGLPPALDEMAVAT